MPHPITATIDTLEPLDAAGTYRAAGELIGFGVPWDAAWSTPVDHLDALVAGIQSTRQHTATGDP